jgi:hypothetical protein
MDDTRLHHVTQAIHCVGLQRVSVVIHCRDCSDESDCTCPCCRHNALAWKRYWDVTAMSVPLPMGSTSHDQLLPFTASFPHKDLDILYIGALTFGAGRCCGVQSWSVGRQDSRITALLSHLSESLGVSIGTDRSLQSGEDFVRIVRRTKVVLVLVCSVVSFAVFSGSLLPPRLSALCFLAQIVLVLQQFGGGGEFHAALLSSVFAHGGYVCWVPRFVLFSVHHSSPSSMTTCCRFVIAERMGLDDDVAVYRELRAFVEVDPVHVVTTARGYALNGTAVEALKSTVSMFLRSSPARVDVASVAYTTFRKLPMSTLLLPAVVEFERRRAVHAAPAERPSGFVAKLSYAVVLVASPGAENRNMEVFDEIAHTVFEGLRELGRNAILILCPHLGTGCANSSYTGDRQVIIVGSNALQLYMSRVDGSLVALTWGLVNKNASTWSVYDIMCRGLSFRLSWF